MIWATLGATGLLLILIAWLRVSAAGKAKTKERNKQIETMLDDIRLADEASKDVVGISDDGVLKRLRSRARK